VHSKEKKRERVKLQVTVQGKERESFCVKMCASFGSSSSSSSRIKIGVVKKKKFTCKNTKRNLLPGFLIDGSMRYNS